MQRLAASLAAALVIAALVACGGDGAEPDATPEGARAVSLVLDFVPNAVHSGIYLARERGYDAGAGIELELREPSDSSDAPKLLEAGRADFAILDIHDLALARERGFDVVGVGAIVQRPLAAVIAANRSQVRRPRDLEGLRVGVTGLPSDDAVVDAVVAGDGGDPTRVERVTIGFRAVGVLGAGRLDAATAFWNAEGVQLRELGVATREFRVDEHGAPPYPELVLATTGETIERDPALVDSVREALRRGYEAVIADPHAGLSALLSANPDLDARAQRAQLRALEGAFEPALALSEPILSAWAAWEAEHGIVERAPEVEAAFAIPSASAE